MKLSRVGISALSLRLAKPLRVGSGQLERRDGFLIELESSEGARGIGVAMPLESFGGESLGACGEALHFGAEELGGGGATLLDSLAAAIGSIRGMLKGRPVASAGLELALRNLDACSRGVALVDSLATEVGRRARPRVRVCALLAARELEECARSAQDFLGSGFRSFKLKVGGGDSSRDIERVRAIRRAVGSLPRIRLDANQAWSFEEARAVLLALEDCGIEFIEEPLLDPNEDELARLRSVSSIAIAADESAVGYGDALRLIEARAVDWIVVKPSVCGGLSAAFELAESAAQAGLGVVVTSFLDAAPALRAALALASLLPADADAGLAGDSIFERDIGVLPLLTDGAMQVDRR